MAASADKGRQVIDGWVENMVAFIETFKQYK